MSLSKGVIDPSSDNPHEMFVGYLPTPTVDRRFLLAALPLGVAALTEASWLVASKLQDPGAGEWRTGEIHQITGGLVTHPYPMIRTPAFDAPYGVRTALLVATGKCNSSLSVGNDKSRPMTASGVLIQRKDRQMLEVPPFSEDWLTPANVVLPREVTNPSEERLGAHKLAGQIMDSKCFFGVMRPGRGKTHKACASLCIRGGIPPSFWARDRAGGERVLLLTDEFGGPVPKEILPYVADPVEAEGEIVRIGDLLEFRVAMNSIQRL